MNEKMKNHIEMLFEDTPQTRRALELKEELLSNSEERYQDLITSGVSPEDAFKNVINSIGNVSELFQGLEDVSINKAILVDEKIKKIALMKATAIGIYIFSVIIFLGFGLIVEWPEIGFIVMLLIDIIPTCMLVYILSLYPKYKKQEDTIVEDFKEWKSDSVKMKSVKSAVTCVLWASTVLLYFAISYATWAWHATWIIFLIGLCFQTIITLIFRLKELK